MTNKSTLIYILLITLFANHLGIELTPESTSFKVAEYNLGFSATGIKVDLN